MELLQFESELMLKLEEEDGLVITAKGIGTERILANLIKVHSRPENLVLILGTCTREEEYVFEQLKTEDVQPLPKVITSECGVNDRYELYMQGGTVFVTSRILVIDMLVGRVPVDLITGIIIYRAHKILQTCQEAFILRLYRQKNKKGFIKALSSSPCAFTRGFCYVQRIMRNLFVRQLYLWPRFHVVVNSSLEQVKPVVIEIQVTMTTSMQAIQMSLLELMDVCVKEVKKMNPTLDTDELTLENFVSKSYDKIIKFQLDPIWNQLGPKTHRLVADLKTLRTILIYLTQYDCITFYSLLKSIRDSVTNNFLISDWLFLDAAESMFLQARARVFGSENKKKIAKTASGVKVFVKPEVSPKWEALIGVLTEVLEDVKSLPDAAPVLIVVEDERTCVQVKDLLCNGPEILLTTLYNQLLNPDMKDGTQDDIIKSDRLKENSKKNKSRKKKGKIVAASQHDHVDSKVDDDNETADSTVRNTPNETSLVQATLIHAVHGGKETMDLQRLLTEHCPKYIVMYDADMEVVRQLEVFQATRPQLSLHVYFLMYKDSAEEQRYLTTLRKEKEAFEYLIKERASMVVPENRDGKTFDHPDLIRDVTPANQTVNTRKAGGAVQSTVQQKVIVDLREFRSDLPSLIHRRGIDIEPITLRYVGDYILTPKTCVERKSLNDLIGSLNSGRLYAQVQAMNRYYRQPILLIEFDQNKGFSLRGKYCLSTGVSTMNVISKLILLTIHFPRLRLLWSPSPHVSSEMFELLKLGKDQPDAGHAVKITSQETEEELSNKYAVAPQDFLSHLPGISFRNVRPMMKNATSLADLITKSKEELNEVLENSNLAKKLWEALHQSVKISDNQLSAKKHF
ncbi:LOW QUALITY PROTEIN: DNA repair endonuclease XPF-like [Tachypleus tridentatus]|uniref:LOW QUALITY PROTEIN: DNA repair endonuclease XPF-like n=1 Tax=Tachypleus tridentatus TaxID=6853 RepID=UPI003FD185FE